MDLTSPDLDQLSSTDDIMNVPEFQAAYQRSNSGRRHFRTPQAKIPRIRQGLQPGRYQKQKEEFQTATRKFIQAHPATVQGIETELTAVNPKLAWDRLHTEQKRKVARNAGRRTPPR